MDVTRMSQGEKVAGISGIALFLIMIIFKWFGLKVGVGGFGAEGSRNAWGSYGFTDIVLFLTAMGAIALALVSASDSDVDIPVALSAIVTGLGIISVILVVISIISPPDFGVDLSGTGVDHTRKIGAFLGLIAAIGVTVGGWLAMQEEGTTFGDQADRMRGGGPPPPSGGPGAGPPPPPPADPGPPPPPPPPPASTP
jgi:hypothetical protein